MFCAVFFWRAVCAMFASLGKPSCSNYSATLCVERRFLVQDGCGVLCRTLFGLVW